jgi:hypothetical protein
MKEIDTLEIEMLASYIGDQKTNYTMAKSQQPHGIAVDAWMSGWLYSVALLGLSSAVAFGAQYFHNLAR